MSRKKTAIRTDNETERAADARMLERRDRAAERAELMARSGGLLPSLTTWREDRDRMTEREMLARARSASRLEMRGASYSAEDRADCAAEIMRRALLETGGSMPRRDSERHTLTVYCGIAKNLRDSLDRLRTRDAADAERDAAERALQPAALGITATPATHAAIVARSSERAAERAADALCALLAIESAERDGPAWLKLYQWATDTTDAQISERRGLSLSLTKKRLALGARFLAGFFSLGELADKLMLGATNTRTIGMLGAEDERALRMPSGNSYSYPLDYGATVATPTDHWSYTLEDRSTEAHGRTPALAASAIGRYHWREGTAAGSRAERAATAEDARAVCTLGKLTRAERVHWTKQRARRADHAQQTADALTRAARAHAQQSRRAASAAPAGSDLARAALAPA